MATKTDPYFDEQKFQQGIMTPEAMQQFIGSLSQNAANTGMANQAVDNNHMSAIFDYPAFAEQEQQRLAKRQMAEQKIAKTNAIADAIKLVAQGIGGAFGATIPRDAPNQNILAAYQRSLALDQESRQRLDNWRMFDLNNKLRQIQYNLGLESEAAQRRFQRDLQEDQQAFSAEQAQKEWTRRGEATEKEYGLKGGLSEKEHEQQMQQIAERGRWQERAYQTYRNPDVKDTWKFTDPATGKTVMVDPQTERDMLYILDQMYPPGSPERPRELSEVLRGGMIRTPAIEYLIQKNYPTLMSQLEAMKSGRPGAVQQQQQQPDINQDDLKRRTRKLYETIGGESGVKRINSWTSQDFDAQMLEILNKRTPYTADETLSDKDYKKHVATILAVYNNWIDENGDIKWDTAMEAAEEIIKEHERGANSSIPEQARRQIPTYGYNMLNTQ